MSHFSVLVIGPGVESQLQPYHEFECTGTDDQFVQDIDITEELRKEYAEETCMMVRVGDDLVSAYDARFYRDPTESERQKIGPIAGTGAGSGMSWDSRDWGDGQGYRTKIHDLGEFGKTEVPMREVKSFIEWAEDWHGKKCIREGETPDLAEAHKYGYVVVDKSGNLIKGIDRTNPGKKWDWWVEGGRYANRLLTARGPKNQATKGEVMFDLIRRKAEDRAAGLWDLANRITGGTPWDSWRQVCDVRFPKEVEKAREFYHAQPAVKALSESKVEDFQWDLDDALSGSREDYIKAAGDHSFSAFAVLKDGKWYERGEMGWFGCVADEKDHDSWQTEFNALIAGLPDDTLLTIVDCHI